MQELEPVESHRSREIVDNHIALLDHHHIVYVRPIRNHEPTVFLTDGTVCAVEQNYTAQVKVERSERLRISNS